MESLLLITYYQRINSRNISTNYGTDVYGDVLFRQLHIWSCGVLDFHGFENRRIHWGVLAMFG